MRNFFVDYHGGASTRAGTQFIGLPTTNTFTRLIPFVFSTAVGQTYILVFTDMQLQFIKNPGGTPPHPNSSNSGFILSGMSPYTISTPYAAVDLPYLKYSQSADIMELTLFNPLDGVSHTRMILKRLADTNWTLTAPTIGAIIGPPATVTVVITPPPGGSTDPLNTSYGYAVTSVADNGEESVIGTGGGVTGLNMQTTAGSVTITWTAVTGARFYNVYKNTPATGGASIQAGAALGYIGFSFGLGLTDTNIIPDFTKTPPSHNDPFPTDGTGPACTAFFQQRLIVADTPNNPITLQGSKPGFFDNFDTSNPAVDSDSFTFTLAAQQVNAIEHMLPMPGGLVLFSDGGVNQLTGGSSNPNNPLAVTPSSAVIVPQSDYGCSAAVRPIKIDYDILYVSSEGTIIIALAYNFFVNIYTGTDISILSNQLFYPLTITDWAWQNIPNKVVWAVRSDGVLLSCTYYKPQNVTGWARHDSQGLFESVATVREGPGTATYFVVNRGGQRFIERLCDRNYVTGVSSAWCLDCALSYSGAPATVITGLSHLNGKSVHALADGIPRGPFTVSSGQITLPVAASLVVVGLSFQCQLQTLYLDVGSTENSVQAKRKKVSALSTRVKDAAGLKMGTSFSTLTPFIPGVSSTDPPQPAPPGLMVGDMRMTVDPFYSVVGQVCIQQDDPLPATVLAVIPEIAVGDTP